MSEVDEALRAHVEAGNHTISMADVKRTIVQVAAEKDWDATTVENLSRTIRKWLTLNPAWQHIPPDRFQLKLQVDESELTPVDPKAILTLQPG